MNLVSSFQCPQFSPRAWGWSGQLANLEALTGFSPRAWGWSESVHRITEHDRVLPTRVGMVRILDISAIVPDGVLPTRVGMVRRKLASLAKQGKFSPRAWGWSVRSSRQRDADRSPHARGDGPVVAQSASGSSSFSSRAWGWSTPTGQSRSACSFSPRAWGWSDYDREWINCMQVLPTRVGMVRCFLGHDVRYVLPRAWGWSVSRRCPIRLENGSPHARGDGPLLSPPRLHSRLFSPRAGDGP